MYLPCAMILSASIDLLPEWLNPIIGSDKEPIRTLLESYEIWWWSGCFFLCSLKKLKEFTLLLPTATSQCAPMTPVPLITETLNVPMVYIDLYQSWAQDRAVLLSWCPVLSCPVLSCPFLSCPAVHQDRRWQDGRAGQDRRGCPALNSHLSLR
jgi:hypothetical protein